MESPDTALPEDFLLENYDFPLPQDRIAQFPPNIRGTSRLFVFDRGDPNSEILHDHDATFIELPSYLPENALLIANNSKVLQARLEGVRETGGRVEFLLLTPVPLLLARARKCPDTADTWTSEANGLIKTGCKIRADMLFAFGQNLTVKILRSGSFGHHDVLLTWHGSLPDIFATEGKLPLPPYIKRKATEEDCTRYQTIYAREEKQGSVAAPTAGLHFTEEIREALHRKGIEWAEVTLYVGYGTFSPVRTPDIRNHTMHAEYIELPKSTAEAIKRAKQEQRPVIAVGTTSVRTLEGAYAALGEIAPFSGETSIFLYPSKRFHVVDGILTNFHLPKSSLIMLVAAFVGRKRILAAYKKAIERNYRFFSYGDAMLIRP